MNRMEPEEKIVEQIKNKMSTVDIPGVPMSRVPRRCRVWFIDYAKDYFCDDRGLCFKHICDTFRGMTPVGYYELQQQIEVLSNELNMVKSTMLVENKDNVIKMADGTEKRLNRTGDKNV